MALLTLLLIVAEIKGTSMKEIYVSGNVVSGDSPSCGQFHHPCSSIQHALQKSTTNSGDIILLDAFYTFYQHKEPLEIRKNVSISSYNCSMERRHAIINFEVSKSHESDIVVSTSNFVASNITIVTKDRKYLISLNDSHSSIRIADCVVIAEILHVTLFQVLDSKHATKAGKALPQDDPATSRVEFHMTQFLFDYKATGLREIKPIDLTGDKEQRNVTVTFYQCRFRNIGIFPPRKTGNRMKFIYLGALSMVNCVFEWSIIFIVFVNETQIEGCSFKNCEVVFPETFIPQTPPSSIIVNRTSFQGTCSNYLNNFQLSVYHNGNLHIESCYFHQANGGCLLVQRSTDVILTGTTFRNNAMVNKSTMLFATATSATISVARSVKIRSCQFVNNTATSVSFTGFIIKRFDIKSKMYVDIFDTKIIPGVSIRDKDPLREIYATNWPVRQGVSVRRRNIYIVCPYNYNIHSKRIKNFDSTYARLTSCIKCNSASYSTNLHAYVKFERKSIRQRNTKCFSCPYQANCVAGIRSKGNYWGYANKSGYVTFTLCPPQFCCSNLQECKTFKTCAQNRKGRLCGDCLEGRSLSVIGGFHKCVKSRNCHSAPFWVSYVILLTVTCLFLLYNKEGIAFLKILILTKILGKAKADSMEDLITESSHLGTIEQETTKQAEEGTICGIIKITFLFYQIASIIRINALAKSNYTIPTIIEIFTSFFNIKIESQTGGHNIHLCPLQTNQVVVIESLKVSIVYACIAVLVASYLIYFLIKKYKTCKQGTRETLVDDIDEENSSQDSTVEGKALLPIDKTSSISFSTRVKGAYTMILILGYSSIANFAFHFINCISIEGQSYLYLQAESIKCYQPWQIYLFVHIALWLIPFPAAVYVGCYLLREHSINSNEFLAILTFPPVMAFYTYNHFRNKDTNRPAGAESSKEATHILKLLNAPFHRSNIGQKFHYIWEPVFLSRRLIMISICTFIISPMIKLFPASFLLLVFLMHDFYIKPFASNKLNHAQCVATMLLILLTMVNFFWSLSNEIDISENPTYDKMGKIFLILEVLILLSPVIYVIALCLFKTTKFIIKKTTNKYGQHYLTL